MTKAIAELVEIARSVDLYAFGLSVLSFLLLTV